MGVQVLEANRHVGCRATRAGGKRRKKNREKMSNEEPKGSM